MQLFTQDQLEAIAGALGDTTEGLTNPEIELLVRSAKMVDPGQMTKRHRIYNAFVESQNSKRNRTHILQFIRLAMSPARYSREPHRFEPMRAALNQALAFAGLLVSETGVLTGAEKATTLPERNAALGTCALASKGVEFTPMSSPFAAQSCWPTTTSTRSRKP